MCVKGWRNVRGSKRKGGRGEEKNVKREEELRGEGDRRQLASDIKSFTVCTQSCYKSLV